MDASSPRLLIVEDQAFFSHILGEALKSSGFDVRVVGDGREALQKAEQFLPRIVLLDIEMPNMSGLDVLEHLRRKWPKSQMAILMSSGRSDELTIARCAELGADAFLKKPYSISQIIHRTFALMEAMQAEPRAM